MKVFKLKSVDIGVFSMIRNLAALISLALVFSGSFALSTQSVEAKTARNSPHRAGNYFVPPPPPYTPSIVPSPMDMTNAQAVTALDGGFSGSLSLSAVEAKTSRNSSHRSRNYLVPPPPPYTPTIVPSPLGMPNVQAVTADAYDAVVKQAVNPYSKYNFTRNQSDMSQVVQPNPYVSYNPGVEKRIRKDIDCFDSQISNIEKEIGKLLNL